MTQRRTKAARLVEGAEANGEEAEELINIIKDEYEEEHRRERVVRGEMAKPLTERDLENRPKVGYLALHSEPQSPKKAPHPKQQSCSYTDVRIKDVATAANEAARKGAERRPARLSAHRGADRKGGEEAAATNEAG